jgi:integrase
MRDDADAEQVKALAKAKTEEDVARINRRREWLFPAVGAEGHQGDLKNAWATIRKKASLPDVRVHDLRHSFASFLASNGASLPLIGAMLGHSQPATTARYAHLFDDAQRKAADQVGGQLSALAGEGA